MANEDDEIPFRTGADNVKAWATNRYAPNIARRVRLWRNSAKKSFRLNLAEMQRIYIQTLHASLASHAKTFLDGKTPTEKWCEDLRNYVQALQDHDYMAQCSNLSKDPFIVSGERGLDREILEKVMENFNTAGTTSPSTDEEKNKNKARAKLDDPIDVWYWEEGDDLIPIAPPRSHVRHSNQKSRLFAATVGAGFLIGPMWLMMVNTGFYTALIATTVFISAFGIMVAVVLDKSNDVFAATLAYAAVLVVFVGLVRSPS